MTLSKLIWLLAGMCAALVIGAAVAHAAPTMKMVTIGGDDMDGSTMIAELGALIFEQDSTLSVGHVMDAAQRPKAYKDIDLQQGDIILMVNGKRTNTADDLNTILDGLKTGDDIKLGIRRDKAMQIVSFKKAAPEDLPQIKMVTQTMTSGEKGDGDSGAQMKVVTRTEGGPVPDGQLAVLVGSGLIFKQQGDAVAVLAIIPDSKGTVSGGEVKEGDRILKMDDTEITDPLMLQEAFDAIEVGKAVTLLMSRDGKEFSVSFNKAEGHDNVMIQKK